MKTKQKWLLFAVISLIAAFMVNPAMAVSEDSTTTSMTAPKEQNLISGTIDYMGSVFEFVTKGSMETFSQNYENDDADHIVYRPALVMNRGSRWVRVYRDYK